MSEQYQGKKLPPNNEPIDYTFNNSTIDEMRLFLNFVNAEFDDSVTDKAVLAQQCMAEQNTENEIRGLSAIALNKTLSTPISRTLFNKIDAVVKHRKNEKPAWAVQLEERIAALETATKALETKTSALQEEVKQGNEVVIQEVKKKLRSSLDTL